MAARAKSAPAGQSPFGRTILVWGPELLLVERAVSDIRERALKERPDTQVNDVSAAGLDGARLAEITGSSLFADASLAVVRDLAALGAELGDPLLAVVRETPPEVAFVVTHHGGQKGKGLLDKVKKSGCEVIECQPVKAWELDQFVTREARRLGARIDATTAQAMVDAIGTDLRALAGAVAQLHADAAGEPITEALVRRYFEGRAEVSSFNVADDVLAGRTGAALEKLRWALGTGVAPVLITSALAGSLRNLGRYLDVRASHMQDNQLAAAIGCPPWKLKDLARQARLWSDERVARGIRLVAQADANIKGAAGSPDFALERLVLELTAR